MNDSNKTFYEAYKKVIGIPVRAEQVYPSISSFFALREQVFDRFTWRKPSNEVNDSNNTLCEVHKKVIGIQVGA